MVEIKKPDFDNMSENKKNFIIGIAVFFILLIIFIIYVSLSGSNHKKTKKLNTKGNFVIWTVGEDSNFSNFIEKIKQKNNLKSLTINVVNFPDYNSYYFALNSAFLKGKSPDIFVVNNNDNYNIFDEKITGFSPKELPVSIFRKKFDLAFSKKLINTFDDNGKKQEYVFGIPLSYETLGVIYNTNLLREIPGNINVKMQNFPQIEEIVNYLKEENTSIFPIGLGDSKVYYSGDIIANIILSLGEKYIGGQKTSQALSIFMDYSKLKKSISKSSKNDIELFRDGKLAIIFGYPRILGKIGNMFDGEYVKASFFPKFHSNAKNTLVNYNYYVINYNSDKKEIAKKILFSFLDEKIVGEYFNSKENNYSFPALLSLRVNTSSKKVNSAFNIYLKDFENKHYNLKSFDKKLKFFYDENIKNVINAGPYKYQIYFQKFNKKLNCLTNKISHLTNLEQVCE